MSEESSTFIVSKEIEYKELKSDERVKIGVQIKAREESIKLKYDTFKHLTTLNTASILLLFTFLEKIFTNPKWKIFVALAFSLFIFSTINSFILMVLFSGSLLHIHKYKKDKTMEWVEDKTFILAFISFFLFICAIICLVIFALINLFT